ncbi:CO3-like protein, partial [Mya arenaria]
MVVFQLSVILCGFLIPVCYAKDYWYVVAPNVFRLNHEETLVAGILGNGSGSVQIKLLLNDVKISQHQAAVRSQDNSDKFTMKVTAENVFQYQELAGPRKKDQKPTHVSLVADFPDGSRSTREVVIGYKSGYLIVQTDKPLYTPREGVNVRVLAMDESLKPIRDQKVYIDIRTPSSDLAGDTKIMAVDRKTFFGSKNGFYRHKFTLPPYPQIGEWTVKAYVYGKNVQGSAGLKFRIVEDNGAENDMFNISRKELTNGLTEFTINVRDLIKARGRGFPDNARLFLEADVIEDATGKEEKSSEDFLIEMTYVNGRKAANQTIKIRYYDRNEERKMTRDEYTTDDRGQLVAPVSTGDQQQTLQFHVHPIDYPGETADYYVKPYIGNNQMVLENVKRIISRGEIVNTLFYNPTNIIIMRMDNHILKKVFPGARLLAFYVDKQGHEIVADSTKFAVDPMCRGEL